MDLIVRGEKIGTSNTKNRLSAALAYLKCNIEKYHESPEKVLAKLLKIEAWYPNSFEFFVLQRCNFGEVAKAKQLTDQVAAEHANAAGPGQHGAEDIRKLKKRLKGTRWSYNATSHTVDLQNENCKVVLSVPFGMFLPLYQHQMDGIQRIFFNYNSALGGLILGDEMGLGKTRQALIAIFSLMLKKQLERVLILCPSGLISTWMAQVMNLLHQSTRLREDINVVEFSSKKPSAERNQTLRATRGKGKLLLVIASTGLISTESYTQSPLFPVGKDREFLWDWVVVDEAHSRAKSEKTNLGGALRSVKHKLTCKAFVLLLTATPIQNNAKVCCNN